MKFLFRFAVIGILLGILSGCANEPANCADRSLLTDVATLVVSQVFEASPAQLHDAGRMLRIGEASATAYDPHLSITTCSAAIALPAIDSIALTYRAPTDRRDRAIQMNVLTPQEAEQIRSLLEDVGVSLPRSLRSMSGVYTFDAMSHPVLVALLQGVLGDQYKAFLERMSVGSGMRREGDLLIGDACMAHFCGTDNAAFAVDVRTHQIVAGMVSDGKPPVLFGVKKVEHLPDVLQDWYRSNITANGS